MITDSALFQIAKYPPFPPLSPFRIPAGALNKANQRTAVVDKVCENIGLVKTVEVENDDMDIAFVEDVVVEAPKDLSKPDEKTPVTVKVS